MRLAILERGLPLAVLVASTPATALAQCEGSTLLAPNPDAGDAFGCSVAVSGDVALVGAYGVDHDANEDSGVAYLIDLNTGLPLHELAAVGGNAFDLFGLEVDLDGGRAIGGAYWATGAAGASGSAYLFDVASGLQTFQLNASDGATDDRFGRDVSISGDRALVGAYWDGDLGARSGSVYLFDATTGLELDKWTASDGQAGAYFGFSVAIDGDRVVVGALSDDGQGTDAGAAYVFDAATGTELFKLVASDAAPDDNFGYSVDVSGSRVIVGAPFDDDLGDASGAAYVFDADTGQQLAKLLPSDGAAGDRFGHVVAIEATGPAARALVGAPRADRAAADAGAAYLFDADSGLELFGAQHPDGKADDRFGESVAIGADWLLLGASDDDHSGHKDAGSVRALRRTAGPVGSAYCSPAIPNSTGNPAVIAARACADLDSNYLLLVAGDLPPAQFGYFLTSDTQGFVHLPPGSQGDLCLGGAIGRFVKQIRNSGAGGELAIQVDLTALPTTPPHVVLPGETWNFQAWFRDKDPGPTSNFTDAVAVTF